MPEEANREAGVEYRPVTFFGGRAGDDERLYADTVSWRRRPLRDLVREKLVAVPERKKLSEDGTGFVDMKTPELIEKGFIKLKPEEKLSGETIVPKTKKELYKEGLITKDAYNGYVDDLRASAYRAESDPLGMKVLRGEIEKEAWLSKIEEIKRRFPKA
jgi:hypothetical protein